MHFTGTRAVPFVVHYTFFPALIWLSVIVLLSFTSRGHLFNLLAVLMWPIKLAPKDGDEADDAGARCAVMLSVRKDGVESANKLDDRCWMTAVMISILIEFVAFTFVLQCECSLPVSDRIAEIIESVLSLLFSSSVPLIDFYSDILCVCLYSESGNELAVRHFFSFHSFIVLSSLIFGSTGAEYLLLNGVWWQPLVAGQHLLQQKANCLPPSPCLLVVLD